MTHPERASSILAILGQMLEQFALQRGALTNADLWGVIQEWLRHSTKPPDCLPVWADQQPHGS